MKTKLNSKKSLMGYFKHIILTFFIFFSVFGFSQFDTTGTFKSNLDLGSDFKSRYIWRGINLGGNTPSIQPFIEYSFAKGFALGTWGAFSFGEQATQEVDLYLSYTTPNEVFTLLLTDYFFPDYSVRNGNFFDLDENSGHVLEFMASFNGTDGFPIGISIATNIAGADKDVENDQSFSTYIEASYGTNISDYVDLSIFAGIVIGNKGGYYGNDETGFINLGITASKSITITDKFSLPIDASFIMNPAEGNVFMVFGFTL